MQHVLGHYRGRIRAVRLKPHAAIAEVVFEGVLVFPRAAAGRYAALTEINGFEHGVIIFYAVGIIFCGSTAYFCEFLAGGGIGYGDVACCLLSFSGFPLKIKIFLAKNKC
jgi:hypothetical protein